MNIVCSLLRMETSDKSIMGIFPGWRGPRVLVAG